jgi:hypothetical protein
LPCRSCCVCWRKWTKLSCRRFKDNEARLHLFALAYNLANFLRQLVLPKPIKGRTLTTGEGSGAAGSADTALGRAREPPWIFLLSREEKHPKRRSLAALFGPLGACSRTARCSARSRAAPSEPDAPEAQLTPQGQLLGLLITGPLGAVAGAALGLVVGLVRQGHRAA